MIEGQRYSENYSFKTFRNKKGQERMMAKFTCPKCEISNTIQHVDDGYHATMGEKTCKKCNTRFNFWIKNFEP